MKLNQNGDWERQYKIELNSINITYPRTVNIIFGNYPYIDVINNLIIDIN